MARVWRSMAFIVAASLLITAAGARFRFLEILAWAVFFGSLYWASLPDVRKNGCRL